jgi:hypothetical protein
MLLMVHYRIGIADWWNVQLELPSSGQNNKASRAHPEDEVVYYSETSVSVYQIWGNSVPSYLPPWEYRIWHTIVNLSYGRRAFFVLDAFRLWWLRAEKVGQREDGCLATVLHSIALHCYCWLFRTMDAFFCLLFVSFFILFVAWRPDLFMQQRSMHLWNSWVSLNHELFTTLGRSEGSK